MCLKKFYWTKHNLGTHKSIWFGTVPECRPVASDRLSTPQKRPLLRLQSQKCASLAEIAKYKIKFTISRFSKQPSYLKALLGICESNYTLALIGGDTLSYALQCHLRFATAHSTNLGGLDEICKLGTSDLWLSSFWKSQLLTPVVISYFVIIA